MRQSYWNDEQSVKVQHEKLFFQQVLSEYHVFTEPNLEDARYFFFTLPSIIIVGTPVGSDESTPEYPAELRQDWLD